jgi:hypothetical protein
LPPSSAATNKLHCFACGNWFETSSKAKSAENAYCHGVKCGQHNFHRRHYLFGRALMELASEAGISVTGIEDSIRSLLRTDSNLTFEEGNRRIDFILTIGGKPIAFDQSICCISPDYDYTAGLKRVRDLKDGKYGPLLKRINMEFRPIILSAVGAMDESFDYFINLCSKFAKDSGNSGKFAKKLDYFYKRVSYILAYEFGVFAAKSYYGINCK